MISENYKRIFRYLLGGGLATATNLGTLFILVHIFNIWYLFSAMIAFCFGVISSYLLQKFFVFKNKDMQGANRQFFIFFIFALFMLGFNTILVYILVDLLGIWYLLAQAISALVTAFINYLTFKKIIFKNGESK